MKINETKVYKQLVLIDLKEKMIAYQNSPPPIPGFKISRLQYLIHLILSHKQDNHPGAYSKLNMAILKSIVPNAGQYLKFLKDENLIEWVNYQAGRNSRLYRIMNEGKTEFRTITDNQLIRRIELSRQQLKRQNSKKYPNLSHTIKMAKIDYQGAITAIEKEYQHIHNEGRRNFLMAEVERISNEDIYITVNNTNFRLDSNFTRLPSYLFEFITLDECPLVELDLINSQPFFSAAIFNPTPEIERIMCNYLGDSFTMYIKSLQLHMCEDVMLYTSLVTTGKFYEHMGDLFTASGIAYENRKDLKTQLFVVFFGKGIAYKYNPGVKVFKSAFPNVHRLFYSIKEKGNNRLAILLQRIESYVMLQKVVPKLEHEFPGIQMLTKHDSVQPFKNRIFYGEQDRTNTFEIAKIMFDEIEKITGFRPRGKAKRYPKIPEKGVCGSYGPQ